MVRNNENPMVVAPSGGATSAIRRCQVRAYRPLPGTYEPTARFRPSHQRRTKFPWSQRVRIIYDIAS